ncbi:hypothetical protein [Chryseobacterium sp. CH21]|uniref:hypothetical protein n=1 Tax=Chryseobacterium sp. CH21 TaxID=713556 RepID=UPI00100A3FF9|nr:hypothetical protein [Chryseobacterium sp. CH21]
MLFAWLTVLGWYYGQIQQYISTDISSGLHFTTDLLVHQKKALMILLRLSITMRPMMFTISAIPATTKSEQILLKTTTKMMKM